MAEADGLADELNDARNALRVYGGHVPPCMGRPCACGFQTAWDRHAAKAEHPGNKARK